MNRSPSPLFSKSLLAYMVVGIFSFMLWGIAYLIWRELYQWFLWITEPTVLLTVVVLPIPYLVYLSMADPGEGGRRFNTLGWAANWLNWMGNGETQRGTLVLLVVLFWTMLFWSWPQPDVRAYPIALTFPTWGLLTIFGLVGTRALFFRQTNLPGPEVPAPGDTKKSGAKS